MALNLFKDRNLSPEDIARTYNFKCMKDINDGVGDVVNLNSNVKQWGAVGDGVADDTVAIQNCINANTRSVYFPDGVYRVTAKINVANKTGFDICAKNAVLSVDVNDYGLEILNSPNFRLFDLKFETNLAVTGRKALNIQGSVGAVDNVQVTGPFEEGIRCGTTLTSGNRTTCLSDVRIDGAVIGVQMDGEYYELANAQVKSCTENGVLIKGGNNSVLGGHFTRNRIGIKVDGFGTANSDHGKIVGATINHNCAAGIYMKDVGLSFHVCGCEIWANSGTFITPSTLVEATSVPAQTERFGIYAERTDFLNIVSNILANTINMGADTWRFCTVTANYFKGTSTTPGIIEYGSTGVNATGNQLISIVGNVQHGTSAKLIEFWGNVFDRRYKVKDNSTTISSWLDVAAATTGVLTFDANYENLTMHVNATAIVIFGNSLGGNSFDIIIRGIVAAETKTISCDNTISAALVPVVLGTGVVYDVPSRTYTFSRNGLYSFRPNGQFMNNWIIQCPP